MALGTLVTAATKTIPAIQWTSGIRTANFVSNLAALNASIKHQPWGQTPGNLYGGSIATFRPNAAIGQGRLEIPGRGCLRLFENDVVAVDPTSGEVFVLHNQTATNVNWTFVADT